MSDEKLDFDEMMALMGVRPIDAPQKKGRGRSAAGPTRPQPAQRPPPPTAPPARSLTTKPIPPASPARLPPPAELRLAEAEAALRTTTEALAAQTAALAAQTAALHAAQAQLAAADAKLREVEGHRQSVHQALQARTAELEAVKSGALGEQEASFTALLKDRGLAPSTESDLFLRAIADAHLGAKLVGLLSTHERSALQAFLDDHLALRGGCPTCPDPAGRALMRVVRGRCDLCEGSDMRRRAADLTEALLLAGHNRVVFVGGSPAYYTQLDKLLSDRRLRITKVPNGRNIRKEDAKSHLQNSHLIVIWGNTIIDHRVTELYTKQPADKARVLTVAHRGMTGMMERVTRALRIEGDA